MTGAQGKTVGSLPEVGSRIRLVGTHPWAGCSGRVVSAEQWMGRPSRVVELDEGADIPTGHIAGLVNPSEWRPYAGGAS